jgi:hypothetical protein
VWPREMKAKKVRRKSKQTREREHTRWDLVLYLFEKIVEEIPSPQQQQQQ